MNSSNFFEEVYSEFQKIKNKGIPVSDQITIQLNEKNHDIIKIEIFSSVGKKLLEASIAGGNDSFSLNLSSLDNGLYYIHTSNKNKAQIEKIIVNNLSF